MSGEIISRPCKIEHNAAISSLSKPNHLIVLANDMGSALGEVQSERGLVCTEIVDVEDELVG